MGITIFLLPMVAVLCEARLLPHPFHGCIYRGKDGAKNQDYFHTLQENIWERCTHVIFDGDEKSDKFEDLRKMKKLNTVVNQVKKAGLAVDKYPDGAAKFTVLLYGRIDAKDNITKLMDKYDSISKRLQVGGVMVGDSFVLSADKSLEYLKLLKDEMVERDAILIYNGYYGNKFLGNKKMIEDLKKVTDGVMIGDVYPIDIGDKVNFIRAVKKDLGVYNPSLENLFKPWLESGYDKKRLLAEIYLRKDVTIDLDDEKVSNPIGHPQDPMSLITITERCNTEIRYGYCTWQCAFKGKKVTVDEKLGGAYARQGNQVVFGCVYEHVELQVKYMASLGLGGYVINSLNYDFFTKSECVEKAFPYLNIIHSTYSSLEKPQDTSATSSPIKNKVSSKTEDPKSVKVSGGSTSPKITGDTAPAKKLEATASSKKSESPASSKKPEAPGSSKKPEAPGSSRSPEASGSSKKPEAPGSSRSPEASGSSRNPGASGSSRNPGASGSSRSPEASGSSRSPEASGSSRSPEASGSSRSPEASGSSRSPEAKPSTSKADDKGNKSTQRKADPKTQGATGSSRASTPNVRECQASASNDPKKSGSAKSTDKGKKKEKKAMLN